MLGLVLGLVFAASLIGSAALGSEMLLWVSFAFLVILSIVGFIYGRVNEVKTMLICSLAASPIYVVGSYLAYGFGMLWVSLLVLGGLGVTLLLVHLFKSWQD